MMPKNASDRKKEEIRNIEHCRSRIIELGPYSGMGGKRGFVLEGGIVPRKDLSVDFSNLPFRCCEVCGCGGVLLRFLE